MAPGPLAQVLRQLPTVEDPNLLTAAIPFADAGVYKIAEDCALVQSVDFLRQSSTIRAPTAGSRRPMRCPTSMPWAAGR